MWLSSRPGPARARTRLPPGRSASGSCVLSRRLSVNLPVFAGSGLSALASPVLRVCQVTLMLRTLVLVFGMVLCAGLSGAQNKPESSTQVDRGRKLFEKSMKGQACSACHSLDGIGTEVGPDLRRLGAYVTPRDLMRTIDMQRTVFVQEVQTSKGSAFPGIQRQIKGDTLDVWDLGVTPPMLRRLKTADIVSMKENVKWGHPAALADYTPQELADIIGFVKWAATGAVSEITPADLRAAEDSR